MTKKLEKEKKKVIKKLRGTGLPKPKGPPDPNK